MVVVTHKDETKATTVRNLSRLSRQMNVNFTFSILNDSAQK